MTQAGLEVLDKPVQMTNVWLNEVIDKIGPDKKLAWHVLGAVLRALRDRLRAEDAAHLAAQLPLVVQGAPIPPSHSTGIHPLARAIHRPGCRRTERYEG